MSRRVENLLTIGDLSHQTRHENEARSGIECSVADTGGRSTYVVGDIKRNKERDRGRL